MDRTYDTGPTELAYGTLSVERPDARGGLYQPSCCLACKGQVWVVRSPWVGTCIVVDAKPVVGGLIEINFNTGSYRTLPIPKTRAKKETHFVRHDCPGAAANVQVFEATKYGGDPYGNDMT